MKHLLLFSFLALGINQLHAQKYYTKNGNISFFSKASLENISADNNQVLGTFDLQSGQLQFSVLIRAFHFKKSLMEEHFNENYMESYKFPKASFKGNISNYNAATFSRDGVYPVEVSGDLTIHGVTNKVTSPASITVKGGVISGNASFKIKLADYKISIPKIVKDNINETVDVAVTCVYDKKM